MTYDDACSLPKPESWAKSGCSLNCTITNASIKEVTSNSYAGLNSYF